MAAKGFSAHCQTGRGKVAADPARLLRNHGCSPMRTLHWPDDPEPPEPDPATLLEDENRRLRETVLELEGAMRNMEGVIRCAGRVLLPYIRAANGGQR